MNATRRLPAVLFAAALVAAVVHADAAPLKTIALGHAGPTLVLLPGLGSGTSDWLPTVKPLLASDRVVLVDLPGQGDNPLPDPFSLEAAANALDATLATLNPDSTVVVGAGLGGLLALMDLSAHPARARGLVLVDVALKSPIPVDDQQKQAFTDFMDQNYEQFTRMLFLRLGRDSTQAQQIYAGAQRVPPATVKAYFRDLLSVDANKAAHALTTPFQLVLTERTYPKGGTWGAAAKTLGWEDTTLTTPRRIANAGYWVMKDQPDTLAAVLAAFAAGHVGRK